MSLSFSDPRSGAWSRDLELEELHTLHEYVERSSYGSSYILV